MNTNLNESLAHYADRTLPNMNNQLHPNEKHRHSMSLQNLIIIGLLIPCSLGLCRNASSAAGAEGEFVDLLASGDLKEHFETTGNWILAK
jgi:hypothetical protein